MKSHLKHIICDYLTCPRRNHYQKGGDVITINNNDDFYFYDKYCIKYFIRAPLQVKTKIVFAEEDCAIPACENMGCGSRLMKFTKKLWMEDIVCSVHLRSINSVYYNVPEQIS